MACLNNFTADREVISIRLRTRGNEAGGVNRGTTQVGCLTHWVGDIWQKQENLWLGFWGPVRLEDVKVAHEILGLTL